MVAVNADRRQIDDCAQMFCHSEGVGQNIKNRIAIVFGWNGNEHAIRLAGGAGQFRRRAVAVEHQHLQVIGIVGIEDRRALSAAHGAGDAREFLSERGDKMLRAIAEAQTEKRRHQSPAAVAAAHSAITPGSVSPPLRAAPRASRSRSSRLSAQTAAPRTSGEESSSNCSAALASVASAELPIAISTLRTKRSRPMRLTALFVNKARNAVSSSRTNSARLGARSASRAASFASRPATANLFHGQT